MLADSTTARGDWLAGVQHGRHVFVIPQYKVLFVSVAKNACTSLKWVMAELAGEDLTTFKAGLSPFTNDSEAIHTRSRFKKALRPDQVDATLRPQIHPDNGWFIFSVVRDPRVRLFSAWQNKMLLQDPAYARYRKRAWYPDLPTDEGAIASAFAQFVTEMTDPAFPLHRDRHFDAQANMLQPAAVPYSRVYPIAELAQLQTDLQEHVQDQGWTQPLTFRRSNDTPLRATAAMFAGEVRGQVEDIYRADFDAYGELWDFADIERAPAWSPAALREVRLRAEAGRRITELRRLAVAYRNRSEKAERRLERLQKRGRAAAQIPDGRAVRWSKRLVRAARRG